MALILAGSKRLHTCHRVSAASGVLRGSEQAQATPTCDWEERLCTGRHVACEQLSGTISKCLPEYEC
eukprot:2859778-Amphidinium_carterae.1